MSGSFNERITGQLGNTRSTLDTVARRCGVVPGDRELGEAVAVQLMGSAVVQRPRPGAVDLLAWIRSRGLLTALVSDCSSELVERWPHHPLAPLLDATVFSWVQGYRKPDPRMFTTAVARLGVAATDCLYVGDGGGRELSGATRAGLTPVLVSNSRYPGAAAYRDTADEMMPELVVGDLDELPELLAEPRN
jgi:putative hydrolase of the HAD superfamily